MRSSWTIATAQRRRLMKFHTPVGDRKWTLKVCVYAHASSCFDLFKKTSLNAEIMQREAIWDNNVIMGMVKYYNRNRKNVLV